MLLCYCHSAQGAPGAQNGGFMYQTPQGLVYATTPMALPEGYIINLPHQQQQQQQQQASGKSIITVQMFAK